MGCRGPRQPLVERRADRQFFSVPSATHSSLRHVVNPSPNGMPFCKRRIPGTSQALAIPTSFSSSSTRCARTTCRCMGTSGRRRHFCPSW
jgi:hypothetical protein